MNLNKHLEFIQPSNYTKEIHVIGIGAVGSRVAEQLARLGFDNIHIYDFDIVEDTNITNQIYMHSDLGLPKTQALSKYLFDINPSLRLTCHERYEDQPLEGAVFLCVDSINTRRRIVKAQMRNLGIDIMMDIRMRLTDGQCYCAVWANALQAEALLNSMSFDDKEDLTPVSVCGTTLSVAPTIMTLVSYQMTNFIRFLKGKDIRQNIFLDMMEFSLNAFSYKY